MALVKYGGGVVQMSGSIAGNTHARNRYGNYIRGRTVPVNPRTDRQTNIRNIMSALVEEWTSTLSPAERAAWNLYAANVSMLNKLGESINLSGFNHYIRSNTFRAYVGNIGQVDPGPVVFELPAGDPTFVPSPQNDNTTDFVYNDSHVFNSEDGAEMGIFMGQPQNVGRNFFNGPWRYHVRIVGDSGAPPASPLAGVSGPYVISPGQRVWWKIRISRADARLSTEEYFGPYLVPA